MKLFSDKNYNLITRYVLIIISITLLIILTIFKLDSVLKMFSIIFSAFSPIIWGIVIAYLLNPSLEFYKNLSKKLFCKKKERKKLVNITSVILTTLSVLSVLTILIILILPQLGESIMSIPEKIKPAFNNFQTWALDIFKNEPEIEKFITNTVNNLIERIDSIVASLTTTFTNIFPELSKGLFNIIGSFADFFLGFIVAIYLLVSKDVLIAQLKKVMFAIFQKKTCYRTMLIFRNSNKMFSGFINGKIIDSFIIGVLAFIFMSIFRFPYPSLISVIIGITNIIPFFGPFIGAIPSGFLILIDSPSKTIPFLIFILVLQQFDGNILGPRILGDTTGLPAFWVLFSIILGSGLFGFAGMLLGVPTFAVIYAIFRAYVETKLHSKRLPVKTSQYLGDVSELAIVKRHKDLVCDDTDKDLLDNSSKAKSPPPTFEEILEKSPKPNKTKRK